MKPSNAQFDYETYQRKPKSGGRILVVIGVAALIVTVFVIFAYIQKGEANKLREISMEWEKLAKQNQTLAAEIQHDAARHAGVMAERIKDLEEQLKECSSK